MFLAEFGTGEVFWSMLWFFLFFIWIWILIAVFSDIFRSRDLSGWGKALWSIFVIFLPYLGVFVYLIARGGKMQQHGSRSRAGEGRAVPRVRSEHNRLDRRESRRRDRSTGRPPHPRRDLRRRVRAGKGEGAVLTKRRQPLR